MLDISATFFRQGRPPPRKHICVLVCFSFRSPSFPGSRVGARRLFEVQHCCALYGRTSDELIHEFNFIAARVGRFLFRFDRRHVLQTRCSRVSYSAALPTVFASPEFKRCAFAGCGTFFRHEIQGHADAIFSEFYCAKNKKSKK